MNEGGEGPGKAMRDAIAEEEQSLQGEQAAIDREREQLKEELGNWDQFLKELGGGGTGREAYQRGRERAIAERQEGLEKRKRALEALKERNGKRETDTPRTN